MKLIQRLKEPSTWAGVAVLGGLFGLDPQKAAAVAQVAQAVVPFVPADGGVIAQTVIGLAGLAAILLPETKAPPAAPKDGA
jgi:hypothetical protein